MDVFELRNYLVEDYGPYARSFIRIEEGLEVDRKPMIPELNLRSEPEASYSLFDAARVFVHPHNEDVPT